MSVKQHKNKNDKSKRPIATGKRLYISMKNAKTQTLKLLNSKNATCISLNVRLKLHSSLLPLCPYGRTFITLCPCGIVPVCWLGLMPADTVIPFESCSHSLASKYLCLPLMVFENVAYWECVCIPWKLVIPIHTNIVKHV